MKFTELPDIVRLLIEFFLPPIIKVSLLFIITLYVLGIRLQNVYLVLKGYFPLAIPNESSQKILSFYGVSTIIPFLVIILFFFVIYITNNLISTIAQLLPGNFSNTSPTSLIYYSDIESLAQLFRVNKKIKNLIDLDEFLEQKVENSSFKVKDGDSPYAKASILRNKYFYYISNFDYLKFLAYYLIALVFVGIFTSHYVIAPRFSMVLTIVFVLGFITLSESIEVYHFYIQAKVEAAIFELNNAIVDNDIDEDREEIFWEEIYVNLGVDCDNRPEPFYFTIYYPVNRSIDNYISVFRAIGFRRINYKKLHSKKLSEVHDYKKKLSESIMKSNNDLSD